MLEKELNCIYLALRKASRRCDNFYSQLTKQYGLTPTQLHILYYIYISPENNTKELSLMLDMSRSTFYREILFLIRERLFIIQGKNSYAKVKNKHILTPLGLKTIEEIMPIWIKFNKKLEDMCGSKDRQVCELLNRIGPEHSFK